MNQSVSNQYRHAREGGHPANKKTGSPHKAGMTEKSTDACQKTRHPREGGGLAEADYSLDYHHLALMQLEAAIDHYFKSTISGHICATTLAGAAEEILGTLLKKARKESHLDALLERTKQNYPEIPSKDALTCLNLYKNGFKHLKEEICEKPIDLELYARLMIGRAALNYAHLTLTKTELMTKFFDYVEKELPDARLRGHDD